MVFYGLFLLFRFTGDITKHRAEEDIILLDLGTTGPRNAVNFDHGWP